jgi:hypothetical protein
MKKKVPQGAWIAAAGAAASALLITNIWGIISAAIAITFGFNTFTMIHKHPKFFKGSWLIIPSVIVASFTLVVSLILHGMVFLRP